MLHSTWFSESKLPQKPWGATKASSSKVAATFHLGLPSPKIWQSTIHHIHSSRAVLGFVCILFLDTPIPSVSGISEQLCNRIPSSRHQRNPFRTFPQEPVNHHSLTCRRHRKPKAVICSLIFSGFCFSSFSYFLFISIFLSFLLGELPGPPAFHHFLSSTNTKPTEHLPSPRLLQALRQGTYLPNLMLFHPLSLHPPPVVSNATKPVIHERLLPSLS